MAAGSPRLTRGRRVSLPGIHELLRPALRDQAAREGRPASGREAHPQKITVYLSADELLDLERARIALRARGLSMDRGRMVRGSSSMPATLVLTITSDGLVPRSIRRL